MSIFVCYPYLLHARNWSWREEGLIIEANMHGGNLVAATKVNFQKYWCGGPIATTSANPRVLAFYYRRVLREGFHQCISFRWSRIGEGSHGGQSSLHVWYEANLCGEHHPQVPPQEGSSLDEDQLSRCEFVDFLFFKFVTKRAYLVD